MSCCAASTNGFLDLKRRAAAPDGRVSAEWSRCPGSMARRPRDSVALLRRSSAGWMPARIERLSAGVRRRHPVTIRKASLMVGSIRRIRRYPSTLMNTYRWQWWGNTTKEQCHRVQETSFVCDTSYTDYFYSW